MAPLALWNHNNCATVAQLLGQLFMNHRFGGSSPGYPGHMSKYPSPDTEPWALGALNTADCPQKSTKNP